MLRFPSFGWIASAAILTAISIAAGPRPLALPEQWTGNARLAERVREAVGPRPGTRAISVAVVERSGTRIAGLGASGDPGRPQVDDESAFEIGSIAKALNGMLLAELADDGEVRLDQRIGDIVPRPPIASSVVGNVTLVELSQHRSGLPRLAHGGPLGFLRSTFASLVGADPYPAWSSDELLNQGADLETGGRGEFEYSNIGAAVPGHTLAAASGQSYPTLLRDRLLSPLGMTSTHVATSLDALPARRVRGTSATGLPREPWTGEGDAPAGCIYSTSADMARLLRAMLEGSAPGATAARPTASIDESERIGLGWFTSHRDGRTITWHNGGTGGFSAWAGFDRDAWRGVVMLSASDRRIDQLGEHLMGVAPTLPRPGSTWPSPLGWAQLAALAFVGFTTIRASRRLYADRLEPLDVTIDSLTVLAVFWPLGPWTDAPWLLWSAASTATTTAAAVLLWNTRRLPLPSARRRHLITGLRVSAAAAIVVALFVWPAVKYS